MAGASMNDIKARIKSIDSTRQITKAMELVATSKLRRAKENAEAAKKYTAGLLDAINTVASTSDVSATPWVFEKVGQKTCYVVIAGDRGLAGGYNNNIFRIVNSSLQNGNGTVLPIGKKSLEYYRHRNTEIVSEDYPYVASVGVGECMKIAKTLSDMFITGKIGRAVIVYTEFVSMLTQTPKVENLLPLSLPPRNDDCEPEYEGDIDDILLGTVPFYLGALIYTGVCQSIASEHASRRSSMSAASKSADEMIDDLMLKYNRARQAVITQEITEIVSGAQAL